MAAELVTILHELVDEEVEISFGFDEEEDINVLVAGSTFMRRKLIGMTRFLKLLYQRIRWMSLNPTSE